MATTTFLLTHLAPVSFRRGNSSRESFTRPRSQGMVSAALATDDITLVQRVQQGDQRAFKLLVERYQRKIYSVALGMVKDKEEARDVAQEAFIKVFKYLDHFKGDASFYTWLYRITVNVCIDVLRKKGSARGDEHLEFDESVRMDISEANLGALGTKLGTNPQKAALRKELADKITAAIAQIPETHRQILLLREVEGMSYEDLARTLDIPKGTVMSRLFHARLKMQKILSGYLEFDEAKTGVGSEG
jgi:RNA polymerase sigma-70 factor, ECF subfamily